MRAAPWLSLVLLFGTAGPSPVPPRREFLLRTEGPLDGKSLADFDGDGRTDILVTSARRFFLFLQGEDGYRSEPHQIGAFHPRAVLYDIGDVTGDGAADIVLITPQGFSSLSLRKGRFPSRPTPLVEEPTIFRGPSPDVMVERDLLQDLDGDGLEDLVLPIPTGIRIYRGRGSGKFERGEELEIPPGAFVEPGRDRFGSEVRSSFWLPEIHPGEYTGDGRGDIGVVVNRSLWVFSSDASGILSRRPTRKVPVRTPKESEGSGGRSGVFRIDFQLPLAIRDINGDEFPDFVTSHVGEGATHIYLGSPERKELRTPSQIVKVNGFSVLNSVQDLDGDGRGDLIIGSLPKFGLWGVLKFFITRSFTATAHVYYNRGVGLFPLVPDYQREIEVPVLIRQGERMGLGIGLIVTASGDLDGDGINDMVIRTADDRIGIFPGRKRAGFAEEPSEEIQILSQKTGGYQVVSPTTHDLNQDGRDDLLLYYRGWDRISDRLTVILSGAGGD